MTAGIREVFLSVLGICHGYDENCPYVSGTRIEETRDKLPSCLNFPQNVAAEKKRAEENTARQVIFSSLDFSMHLKFSLITNHKPFIKREGDDAPRALWSVGSHWRPGGDQRTHRPSDGCSNSTGQVRVLTRFQAL